MAYDLDFCGTFVTIWSIYILLNFVRSTRNHHFPSSTYRGIFWDQKRRGKTGLENIISVKERKHRKIQKVSLGFLEDHMLASAGQSASNAPVSSSLYRLGWENLRFACFKQIHPRIEIFQVPVSAMFDELVFFMGGDLIEKTEILCTPGTLNNITRNARGLPKDSTV